MSSERKQIKLKKKKKKNSQMILSLSCLVTLNMNLYTFEITQKKKNKINNTAKPLVFGLLESKDKKPGWSVEPIPADWIQYFFLSKKKKKERGQGSQYPPTKRGKKKQNFRNERTGKSSPTWRSFENTGKGVGRWGFVGDRLAYKKEKMKKSVFFFFDSQGFRQDLGFQKSGCTMKTTPKKIFFSPKKRSSRASRAPPWQTQVRGEACGGVLQKFFFGKG